MKRTIFIAIIFTVSLQGFSQKKLTPYSVEKADWQAGTVYFPSGEKVNGELHYDPTLENLYIKKGGKINTYSPDQIRSFSLGEANTHEFISLPFEIKETGKVKTVFFHQLRTHEKFQVLSRISNVKRETDVNSYYHYQSDYLSIVRTYYLSINDEMVELSDKSNENREILKRLFPEDYEVIYEYAKTQKLKFKKWQDISTVLEYHFSTTKKQAPELK